MHVPSCLVTGQIKCPSPKLHVRVRPLVPPVRLFRSRSKVTLALLSPPPPVRESITAPPPSATTASKENDFWSVVSNTTIYANQLLSHFKVWTASESGVGVDSVEKVLQEASDKEKQFQKSHIPPDILSYLRPASVWEMKYLRKLCSLTGLTYKLASLTPASLRRRFRLDLVSTSLSCDTVVYEHDKSALEVIAEGDGMGVSIPSVAQEEEAPATHVAIEASNIVSAGDLNFTPSKGKWASPADLVAAKLAEAAAATSAAAASSAAAVAPLASAATSLYTGSVSFLSSQLGYVRGPSGKTESVPAGLSANGGCPSEWFVCDDPKTHVRYFVIQGSDTVDHWRVNLTFDPVPFEDPSLGVKVHRGAYESAMHLYDKFLPLIHEHLDSSPFAKVCLVGHSMGGSLATLLLLMLKNRGVLTSSSIAPVYTFGAPAMLCDGCATGDCLCQHEEGVKHACTCGGGGLAAGTRVLHELGLNEGDVINVMMHRDIVPRAFTCDYSLVSDLLKSWGVSFREHACLGLDGRKHLYYFVGSMLVLQPDIWHSFVNNEPFHPMLPSAPGLFHIAAPAERSRSLRKLQISDKSPSTDSISTAVTAAAMPSVRSLPVVMAAAAAVAEGAAGGDVTAAAAAAAAAAATVVLSGAGRDAKDAPVLADAGVKPVTLQPARGAPATSLVEVVSELMDNPHPLEILSDPGAYLEKGSISRYHNPDNYSKALGRLIFLQQRRQDHAHSSLVREVPKLAHLPGEAGASWRRQL